MVLKIFKILLSMKQFTEIIVKESATAYVGANVSTFVRKAEKAISTGVKEGTILDKVKFVLKDLTLILL